MLRTARRGDFAALSKLWKEAFLEEEATAQFIFESFAGYENVYLWEESEQIVAMLCAVPCSFQNWNGRYLYGVATQLSCRGQGIMSHMIELTEKRLCQSGADFIVLVPAANNLVSFYQRLGYRLVSGRNHFQTRIPNMQNSLAETTVCRVLPEKLRRLRMEWLNTAQISFSGKSFAAVCDDLNAGHAQMLFLKSYYAVFRLEQNRLWIDEIAADCLDTFYLLLSEAAKRVSAGLSKPVEWAEGILLDGVALSELSVARNPFGMGKQLSQTEIPLEKAWMNLMLN